MLGKTDKNQKEFSKLVNEEVSIITESVNSRRGEQSRVQVNQDQPPVNEEQAAAINILKSSQQQKMNSLYNSRQQNPNSDRKKQNETEMNQHPSNQQNSVTKLEVQLLSNTGEKPKRSENEESNSQTISYLDQNNLGVDGKKIMKKGTKRFKKKQTQRSKSKRHT